MPYHLQYGEGDLGHLPGMCKLKVSDASESPSSDASGRSVSTRGFVCEEEVSRASSLSPDISRLSFSAMASKDRGSDAETSAGMGGNGAPRGWRVRVDVSLRPWIRLYGLSRLFGAAAFFPGRWLGCRWWGTGVSKALSHVRDSPEAMCASMPAVSDKLTWLDEMDCSRASSAGRASASESSSSSIGGSEVDDNSALVALRSLLLFCRFKDVEDCLACLRRPVDCELELELELELERTAESHPVF